MSRFNQTGDTLIEIILALAIMSLVIITSTSVALSTFRQGREANLRTRAANLLQEQAEALRSLRNRTQWNGFAGSCGFGAVGFTCEGPPNGIASHFCAGALTLADLKACPNVFHMERNGNEWVVVNQPEQDKQPFTISIRVMKYPPNADNQIIDDPDNLALFHFEAKWPAAVTGPDSTAEFPYLLTNRHNLLPADCDAKGYAPDPQSSQSGVFPCHFL